jgi:ankyrin repeat protein
VRRLVQEGEEVEQAVDLPNANKQVVVGVTPLYLAAQQGHHVVCQYLLEQGADPLHRCSIPATGEVFGAAEIALIHFHFRTWWFLNRVKGAGNAGRRGVPRQLAEPLLS